MVSCAVANLRHLRRLTRLTTRSVQHSRSSPGVFVLPNVGAQRPTDFSSSERSPSKTQVPIEQTDNNVMDPSPPLRVTSPLTQSLRARSSPAIARGRGVSVSREGAKLRSQKYKSHCVASRLCLWCDCLVRGAVHAAGVAGPNGRSDAISSCAFSGKSKPYKHKTIESQRLKNTEAQRAEPRLASSSVPSVSLCFYLSSYSKIRGAAGVALLIKLIAGPYG